MHIFEVIKCQRRSSDADDREFYTWTCNGKAALAKMTVCQMGYVSFDVVLLNRF